MARRGFSLLETLLALALLVSLSGVLLSLVESIAVRRDRALVRADRGELGQLIIDRLESDLMTALVGGGVTGTGLRGDETSIRVLSRGVVVGVAVDPADEHPVRDATVTELRFDARAGGVRARRADPMGGRSDTSLLGPGIVRMRLRYHDGVAWRERFDSVAAGGLPKAVEIALWFGVAPEADPDRPGLAARGGDQGGALDDEAGPEDAEGPPPDRRRVIALGGVVGDDAEGGAP